MGQYHYICNLDRHEYLDPHQLGDGLKLMEFGNSACGTLTALAILLAASNGRGGGDLRAEDNGWIGNWAGDRIAIIGDYHEPGDVPGFTDCGDTPWDENDHPNPRWTEVSQHLRPLIEADGCVRFEAKTSKWIMRDQDGNESEHESTHVMRVEA